jgi:hypothetical protein
MTPVQRAEWLRKNRVRMRRCRVHSTVRVRRSLTL